MTKTDAEKIVRQINGSLTGELDLINFYQVETKTTTEEEFNKLFEQLQLTAGVEIWYPPMVLSFRILLMKLKEPVIPWTTQCVGHCPWPPFPDDRIKRYL